MRYRPNFEKAVQDLSSMETRKKSPRRKCRCSLPAPGAIAGDSIANLARKRDTLKQENKAEVIAIDAAGNSSFVEKGD